MKRILINLILALALAAPFFKAEKAEAACYPGVTPTEPAVCAMVKLSDFTHLGGRAAAATTTVASAALIIAGSHFIVAPAFKALPELKAAEARDAAFAAKFGVPK